MTPWQARFLAGLVICCVIAAAGLWLRGIVDVKAIIGWSLVCSGVAFFIGVVVAPKVVRSPWF